MCAVGVPYLVKIHFVNRLDVKQDYVIMQAFRLSISHTAMLSNNAVQVELDYFTLPRLRASWGSEKAVNSLGLPYIFT